MEEREDTKMTKAKKAKILEAFRVAFPKVWVKPGNEFNGCENAVLWSGESSFVVETYTDPDTGAIETYEVEAFNYYAEDYKEVTYILGVHKALVAFADRHGIYWECNDPGTYIAFVK